MAYKKLNVIFLSYRLRKLPYVLDVSFVVKITRWRDGAVLNSLIGVSGEYGSAHFESPNSRIVMSESVINRASALELMHKHTRNEALRRHMYAVEIAMRAYADKLGEDVERWGVVGLLHDFDYEENPQPPDHPLVGSGILADLGYPEDVMYAIKSHVDHLPDCPRVSVLDKALFACDELCGFIVAVGLVRPEGLQGMKAKSVRKKMKQKAFAAAVSREDITRGAEDFGVELNEHIQFCIDALLPHAELLGFESDPTSV